MSNLTFYPQSIDDATLAVTSEATGFEKEFLQDRRTFTSWKSTSTANQNIDIDFGAARPLDYFLLYHALADGVNVSFWGADAANYSDEAQLGATQTIASRPTLLLTYGVTYNYRYYRIKITNLAAAAQVYLIFAGVKKEISVRHNYGQFIGNRYNTRLIESLAGYRSADSTQAAARRVWDLQYEFMSKANRDNLASVIASTAGMRYPIFMLDPDDSAYYYVRLMVDSLDDREVAHELYNLGRFQMEQEL